MGKRLAWLVSAALLLAVGAWVLSERSGAPEEPAAGPPPDSAAAPEPDSEVSFDGLVDPPAPGVEEERRAELPTGAAATDAELDTAPEEEDSLAHVVGRLLLPSGAPAVDASIKLRGFGANSERRQKYGVPKDWQDLTGTTDAEGRFDLALDPPRAFQFMMDASIAGHSELSWRWSSLPPGSTTDVGAQTFAQGCRVTGKVVGKDGQPTGVQWFVYGDSTVGASGKGSDSTRVVAAADVATGAFELNGVPPGPVELKAHSKKANWIDGPTVQASPDEVATADIVYDGPDLGSTISITTFCRPFHIFDTPEGLRIVARSADGTEFEAERIQGSSQSFRVQDLAPGSYTIEATSPVHETWTKEGVKPGDRVSIYLRGGARLALTVLDDATGEPVESYRLRVRFNGSRWSPNVFPLLERGKEPPAGGLYGALIPWDVTLLVDAEGFAPLVLPVGKIDANTTTPAEARLSRGGQVDVLVVDGTGKAAPGAKVTLHPFHEGYDPRDVFSGTRALRSASVELTTGSDGRASFEAVAPGSYGLLAVAGALDARKDRVEVIDAARISETLNFPQSGSIAGRLTGGGPGEFEGLRIRADSLVDSTSDQYFIGGEVEPGTAPVAADGTFHIEALRVGTYRMELYLPARMVPTSSSSSTGNTGQDAELGEVSVAAGDPTQVTLDASAFVPGAVAITASRNGDPAAGLLLRIQRAKGGGWDGAVLSAEGTTRFDPVFPGQWTISVRSMTDGWVYTHPEILDLAPGQESAIEISFETARGRVRVFDAATGDPVGSRQVFASGNLRPTTDDEGWLDLEFPVGPVTLDGVRSWPEPSTSVVTLDWGPMGPSVQEVTLTFGDDK